MPNSMIQLLKCIRYVNTVRSIWSPEADIMVALVDQGNCVLDIGGYAGWYTRVFSEAVGPEGQGHSFEPVPTTFSLLRYCTRRLSLRNVVLHNCAASSSRGTAVMTVPHYPGGGKNYHQVRGNESPERLRHLSVDLRTVDSELPRTPRPITLIKGDVEGHRAALEGAAGTIERDRPALCVEVTGDPDAAGSSSHRIVSSLGRLGYEPYWLGACRLVRRRAGDRRKLLSPDRRSPDPARRSRSPGRLIAYLTGQPDISSLSWATMRRRS